MSGTPKVKLKRLVDEFALEKLCYKDEYDDIIIATTDINRPGLQLAGFFEYFGTDRVQIFGKVEMTYLADLEATERYERLKALFSTGIPCVVLARGMQPFPEMIQAAKDCDIPFLRTDDVTSRFSSNLIAFLNVELAPMEIMHGELVEVYGEGVLILGESGVGKSETALELVKRGHRLVADDLVEVRRVSSKTLVGMAPEVIRHFIEIRGIGILDVKYLYGVGSVKITEKIDLVINMELWDQNKHYERVGSEELTTEILGIKVPSLTIPVRPGRNLAIIIEVAALNNRQKKMGYNAAKAFTERIAGEINKNIEN
ncbi:MAG: HPr kinase/phosphorylase [Clostridiaceae bacterium]|nr:HPr kinase/phosphorylase [Clostridiaceae bacterium]